ncbi:hypothetical protein EYF80_028043 [Liparis tanakae]|uniref:Uncharacterized protein n=1 Tax=Liparis tanakae TaxID=230148 RepID=A0A4Z2HA35_9TELE|nr:hypothetical protein EYF80_028043 [Liparis tanakae]
MSVLYYCRNRVASSVKETCSECRYKRLILRRLGLNRRHQLFDPSVFPPLSNSHSHLQLAHQTLLVMDLSV